MQAGPKWSWRNDSTEEPIKLGVSVHVGRVEVEFKECNEQIPLDEQSTESQTIVNDEEKCRCARSGMESQIVSRVDRRDG